MGHWAIGPLCNPEFLPQFRNDLNKFQWELTIRPDSGLMAAEEEVGRGGVLTVLWTVLMARMSLRDVSSEDFTNEKKLVTDIPTDRRTDGRTDTTSYRDAMTHLTSPFGQQCV